MNDLEINALQGFLESKLPDFRGPLLAKKFPIGQSNPTYQLVTPGRSYVLRRKPMGKLLKSAHAIDREFRVQKALFGTSVPVPEMLLYCEDQGIIGSDFYIMSYLQGRNFGEPTMPGQTPRARAEIIDEMNRVLASLHSLDPEALELSDYGPDGNYFERQISRWSRQYKSSETETIADMDKLIEMLPVEMPQDDGQRTLVHGDYRIDNLLFEPHGTACIGVLDWELSTTGHPFADLASVIMQWQMPPGPEGRGLAGTDRVSLGLPSDQDFVDLYCKRRGIAGIERFEFFLAFAFFRMAAILQGVHKRALEGSASDPERGLIFGRYVPIFAEQAMVQLQRI